MKENYIDYKGMKVFYDTFGEITNPAVVMLHPAFGDYHIFFDQIDYFKDRYFIIVFDMVGHGRSKINGSNANLSHMPEVISGVLKGLGIDCVHVLGISMGAIIAQSFAYRYSEQVQSVTIVGGYSIHKAYERVIKSQNKEMIKWVFFLIFSLSGFRNYVLKKSVVTERGRCLFSKGISQFTRGSFKAMQGLNTLFEPMKTPVPYSLLIVCGSEDLEIIRRASKELEALEPESCYAEISNAGHCANADNSDAFNQLLDSFWGRRKNGPMTCPCLKVKRVLS